VEEVEEKFVLAPPSRKMPNSTFIPEPTDPVSETLRMLVKAVLDTLSLLILIGLEFLYSTAKKAYVKHKTRQYDLNLARYTANRDTPDFLE
jgi:hypothetical protein